MAFTDHDALERVQYAVLESPDNGATWPSGLWSKAEVLAYFNQRQQRFIKDTGCLAGFARFASAQQLQQDLPDDWLITLDAAWIDSDGVYHPLDPSDSWELTNGLPSWPTATGTPEVYSDTETETLTFRLIPAPNAAGTIELLYIALADELTGDGEPFTLPDEFVPGVIWGVLADMLNKLGRAHDAARAAYAEARYREWVALTQLLVLGFD